MIERSRGGVADSRFREAEAAHIDEKLARMRINLQTRGRVRSVLEAGAPLSLVLAIVEASLDRKVSKPGGYIVRALQKEGYLPRKGGKRGA